MDCCRSQRRPFPSVVTEFGEQRPSKLSHRMWVITLSRFLHNLSVALPELDIRHSRIPAFLSINPFLIPQRIAKIDRLSVKFRLFICLTGYTRLATFGERENW